MVHRVQVQPHGPHVDTCQVCAMLQYIFTLGGMITIIQWASNEH